MNKFNSNTNKKDDGARQDINSRMQTFMTPNYNTAQVGSTDNKQYQDDNLLGSSNKSYSLDRSDFKNDINQRMDSFNRMGDVGHKQLPFHNNIRDYTITMDSKKDEFNNRLSNYNHLSSNITPNVIEENKYQNMGFHKNFKDDTNQRLDELSPLSRNLGIPFNGTQMPSKPDFGSNIQNNNTNDKYTNYNYNEQFNKKDNDVKEQEIYIKNYEASKTNDKINLGVNSNSYDNPNYSSFEANQFNLNRNEENLKRIQNQKDIQGFDYSIISNNTMNNNNKRNDGINNTPELAVYNSMPVDTRQEFHFQQSM
jgi:hypothetical protein